MDSGVPDHAVAHLLAAGLELRLDKGHDPAALRAETACDRCQDAVERDERDVHHGQVHGARQDAGTEGACVGALHRNDARIVAQRFGELAAADIEGVYAAGVALDQQVGEAPGRGTDVQAHEPDGFDPESVESRAQLEPSARYERRRCLYLEFDRRGYEIAGLTVGPRGGALADPHVAAEDVRLGASSGLRQTALDEQLVEASTNGTRSGWAHDPNPVTPGSSRAALARGARSGRPPAAS